MVTAIQAQEAERSIIPATTTVITEMSAITAIRAIHAATATTVITAATTAIQIPIPRVVPETIIPADQAVTGRLVPEASGVDIEAQAVEVEEEAADNSLLSIFIISENT